MKKLARILGVATIVSLVLTTATTSGPIEDAETANERGDYTTAMRLYRPLAERGNASAQVGLGVLYEHGQGIDRSFEEAAKWYRLAAEQGRADAQLFLGVLYAQGRGVPQDDKQSAKWYRLAAEQGVAPAQSRLGTQYETGSGVTKDWD